MKLVIALLLLVSIPVSIASERKYCTGTPVRIAVLDTGFGFADKGHEAKLCRYGHKDFSKDQKFVNNYQTVAPVPQDLNSHGTNIVGIIESYAKKNDINYCIVVLKYYSGAQNGYENTVAEIKALEYAANLKVDFINLSGGGPEFNEQERLYVKRFLDGGGTFVAAAMNDGQNIDIPGNAVYPAMYDDRIFVVGNLSPSGERSPFSNYGAAVTRWEVGENVTGYGVTLSGTSQATAVATGKLVSESDNKCDIGIRIHNDHF